MEPQLLAICAILVGFLFSPWRLGFSYILINVRFFVERSIFVSCVWVHPLSTSLWYNVLHTTSHNCCGVAESPSPIRWPLFFFLHIHALDVSVHRAIFYYATFCCLSVSHVFFFILGPCLLLFCAPSVPHACRVSTLMLLCVSGTHSL